MIGADVTVAIGDKGDVSGLTRTTIPAASSGQESEVEDETAIRRQRAVVASTRLKWKFGTTAAVSDPEARRLGTTTLASLSTTHLAESLDASFTNSLLAAPTCRHGGVFR